MFRNQLFFKIREKENRMQASSTGKRSEIQRLTLNILPLLHILPDLERLAGMDDVDDGTRACCFEVLEKNACGCLGLDKYISNTGYLVNSFVVLGCEATV